MDHISRSVLLVQLLLLMGAVLAQAKCPIDYDCIAKSEYGKCRTKGNDIVFSCGVDDEKLCCPTPTPTTPEPSTLGKRLRSLLPEECGAERHMSYRIWQGEEADLGQFPWMVRLAFKLSASSEKKDYLCGATLISSRYVLTAAHCVNDVRVGRPVSVRLGEHDMTSEQDCTDSGDLCSDPPLDVDVEEVIAHEQYNTPFLKNDIALIRLKVQVNLTKYIKPICLPTAFNVTEDEGRIYNVAGWGLTTTTSVGSTILMFTNMTGLSIRDCASLLIGEYQHLNETQLCAGQIVNHGDTCKGDSGGPLMYSLADSGGTLRTYQVGVVSFGSVKCGGDDVPSVFTRVGAYIDWIESKMKN